MLVPNRTFSSPEYRYGFNGKEKDDEVKGSGMQYDYGFRIYDPRIGKFLSLDPLFQSFPYYTPYQFAGNKPIWAIDLDGLEEAKMTETKRILRTIIYDVSYNRVQGDFTIIYNEKTINISSGTSIISPGYPGSQEVYETRRYYPLKKPSKNGIKSYKRIRTWDKTVDKTNDMPLPPPPPPKVDPPKPAYKTVDVYKNEPITITTHSTIRHEQLIEINIPFKIRKAAFKNTSSARNKLDPLIDKLKENRDNHLVINVNVQNNGPKSVVSYGWPKNYLSENLAQDRIQLLQEELQNAGIPLSQFKITSTIDLKKDIKLTGTLTIVEKITTTSTSTKTKRVKVGTKKVLITD